MRKVIFSCVLLFCALSAFAATDTLLRELDNTLSKKEVYTQERLKRILSLKAQLKKSPHNREETYKQYLSIFEEYKTLNFDSALNYAGKIKLQAELLKDPQKINRAKINLAFILLSSGMFKETHKQFEQVDFTTLNTKDKVELLTLKTRYYYDLCDFVKNYTYCSEYVSIGNQLADSAIALASPRSYDYYFISGLKNLRTGRFDEALNDYLQILNLPDITLHQYAIIASTLSYLYGRKHQKKASINLLIKAAIADVKSSTKENLALFKLADTLFKSGMNENAYKYIREAMADAEYYGARQRQFEVGTLLPIIEGKQITMVKKQNNLFFNYAASVTFLVIVIIGFIYLLVKQNRKLRQAQDVISRVNIDLQEKNVKLTDVNKEIREANKAIREANRIKDEYIGYYFNINSDYIDKIGRFKKSVSQRLALGRYKAIEQLINNIDLKKEREDLSVGFDRVFIKLFPNFLKEFNELLEEKEQIELPDGQLLNAELRIFALIRLGIHDNETIAKVMNLSVNTIYAYKTRIRNKSFVPNEQFEARVIEIETD